MEAFMKTATLIISVLMSAQVWAAPKTYVFAFKSMQNPIKATATTKEEAFKIAAKTCFNQLTGGKYPGEEKGMDIIDICANPKM
jgi:hypothetical protein